MRDFGKNIGENGVSLIEVMVVVFIILIFLTIIVSDFPKIMRMHALSRVTYKLGQDLRRAEDFGLSGVKLKDGNGVDLPAKGYGVYFGSNDTFTTSSSYIIYADIGSDDVAQGYTYGYNKQYDAKISPPFCEDVHQTPPGTVQKTDCIIEKIDLKKENKSLFIQGIKVDANSAPTFDKSFSINFTPPNPTVNIRDGDKINYTSYGIEIFLKNTDNATRSVYANTSGLIDVK